MRKFLLASVATLGAGGLIGTALAQAPAGAPTQGQAAWPLANPTSYVNNNNNYQAPALPGALANPTPGTIVVHVNGKVQVDFQTVWTGVDTRFATLPATGSLAQVVGVNGTGSVKLMPQAIDSFGRIYLGGDAMATNGLRYGAAIEVRQNFTGQISNNGSSGASGYSSLETLYIRRAFMYVAGEQWGIVRVGQADGLISIFDNGVTTFQFTPTGNLNGGDLQNQPGGTPSFVFLGQAGNEYDNAKAVYLSPQIAGFDFGIQYAPNTSNGNGISAGGNLPNFVTSLNGAGIGTGNGCTVANTGCPTLSSGPGIQDGARSINQWAVGARYQGTFGGAGVLAYAVGEFSGHANYTGLANGPISAAAAATILGTTNAPTSAFNGSYKGLAIGSGGVAVTYAGFTVGGNVVGGNMNGQLGLQPQGGAGLFGVLAGVKYTAGPLTVGVVGEEYWEQGNVVLSGVSQLRARGISVAGSYTVAPGFTVFSEYLWNDQQQAFRNFLTGAVGTTAAATNPNQIGGGTLNNNNIKGQGFLVGSVVNF